MTTTPTKNESLPELPEASVSVNENGVVMAGLPTPAMVPYWANTTPYYTKDQMLAYGRACAALTREAPTEAAGDKPRHDCQDPECGCKDPAFTEPMEALAFLSGRFKYAGVSHAVAMHYARDIDAILTATQAAPQRMAQGEDVSEVTATIVRDVCETDPADPDDEDTISVSRDTLTMIVERAVKAAMNERSPSLDSERECSDHPDAPHGFDRNGSHNAGRYVCECEGWRHDDEAIQPPHQDRGEEVTEPGAIRALVTAANAVLALHPEDDGMWTLELAVRPFNAAKPAECANGCPANTVCDYCQIAALTEAKQQGPGEAVPSWIVNDLGELGVMVNGVAYFLYKGDNIVYEDAKHDDGSPMLYRMVGKREFGETCWPRKWIEQGHREDRYTVNLTYTPGLSDGKPEDGDWRPLPTAPQVEAKRQTGGDA